MTVVNIGKVGVRSRWGSGVRVGSGVGGVSVQPSRTSVASGVEEAGVELSAVVLVLPLQPTTSTPSQHHSHTNRWRVNVNKSSPNPSISK